MRRIFRQSRHSLFEKEGDYVELIKKKQIYLYNDPRIRFSLPFLKYHSYDGIEANVFINHISPCFASGLFEKYYEFDSRLSLITDFLLNWACKCQILNEFNGYLSSYAFTLLIIFFLQILELPLFESIQQYAITKHSAAQLKEIPSFQEKLSTGKKLEEVREMYVDVGYKKVNARKMKRELGYPKNYSSPGELITLFFYYFGFEYHVLYKARL
eukprot:TRINITY_DN5060_c0_g1_i11.p1 TRINITY_DN5060_c0_g1~~TRINITY_DN5060_c0_g1_i11.p1  ORF type:complete len:213 (+),score=42.84 TRINITY_DN5060_c0_g1_i11:270-908(+)